MAVRKAKRVPSKTPKKPMPACIEMMNDGKRNQWAWKIQDRRRRRHGCLFLHEADFNACLRDYLEWCRKHPLTRKVQYKDEFIEEPCERNPTAMGFREYAGIAESTWRKWRNPTPDGEVHDLQHAVENAMDIFSSNMNALALYNIVNPLHASKMTGLVEKHEIDQTNEWKNQQDDIKIREMLGKLDSAIDSENGNADK